MNSKMWVLFCGTTEYKEKLLLFLASNIKGYTLLEGVSGWKGLTLNAQVIIFFELQDALKTQEFMLNSCRQQSVPLMEIKVNEI